MLCNYKYSRKIFSCGCIFSFYGIFCDKLCNGKRKCLQIRYIKKTLFSVTTLDSLFVTSNRCRNECYALCNILFADIPQILFCTCTAIIFSRRLSVRYNDKQLDFFISLNEFFTLFQYNG